MSKECLQKSSKLSYRFSNSYSAFLHLASELSRFPPYESCDQFIRQFIHHLMIGHKLAECLVDAQTARLVVQEMRDKRITRTVDDSQLVVKNVADDDNHSKKSKSYLRHLTQLRQHLEKHPVFNSKNFRLTPIDSLITTSDESVDCIVFGFLVKNASKINELVVEDNTGRVPLVFTDDTQFRDALVVENSFVIIEGTYDSPKDCLYVESIGQSPPIDLSSAVEVSDGLQRIGRMLVVISDIHLDDENTLDKLKTLLTGYDSMVPIPDAFLFVGDFMSKPCDEVSDFKAHMKNFVKIISKFTKISNFSQLIFIPGFNDIKGNDIPKSAFTVDMFPMTTKLINNYHLATNPVNIYIDGRHICLSAIPYMSKLRKHIIHNSTEDSTELGASIAKLITCNGHLSAGLSHNLHNSLSLFHLPDFVLISDKHMNEDMDSNAHNYTDLVVLPSFSRDNFRFKVFYTNPKHIECSQILV
ncbi:unnamed protein product [Medioppia subpectinata]|uniref:DNA polymerase II subunit 2 n=1 Tax=Medioppia subpectinata TaxID=1979941 RepID=A0A7R9PUX4_9ACAR|nr:unnamed protein product [Medioppia subpectinata]CAG2101249.1 unnamed protein product [Medioppia subpectinata]